MHHCKIALCKAVILFVCHFSIGKERVMIKIHSELKMNNHELLPAACKKRSAGV